MSGVEHDPAVEEVATDLSNPDVVTKYRAASDIANQSLKAVIAMCKPGADVTEVCTFGDKVIEGQCAKIFKSKKIEKGVAFPTCLSLNECVCHFSPYEVDSVTLKAGDRVKVDMGVHMDGYIAIVAHTFVCGEEGGEANKADAAAADVMVAAHTAAQVACKMIKPGAKSTDVTKAIQAVAAAYGVTCVQGTLTHQLKRYVIDGQKVIAQADEPDARLEEVEFEENEVYGVDVCFSTGEGKPKELGASRTMVYKRVVDRTVLLRLKAGRYVMSEVNRKFPVMPFTLRALEDAKQAKLGVNECVKNGLLLPYQIVHEPAGAEVAHFKFTVLLMPSGNLKITGLPLPEGITSEKTLPEDIAKVLATSSKKKKNKKKKAKKAAAGGGGDA
jgi:curved DNA binding protein